MPPPGATQWRVAAYVEQPGAGMSKPVGEAALGRHPPAVRLPGHGRVSNLGGRTRSEMPLCDQQKRTSEVRGLGYRPECPLEFQR
jgi:hypothetical protein